MEPMQSDHNKQLITLTMITLSGSHFSCLKRLMLLTCQELLSTRYYLWLNFGVKAKTSISIDWSQPYIWSNWTKKSNNYTILVAAYVKCWLSRQMLLTVFTVWVCLSFQYFVRLFVFKASGFFFNHFQVSFDLESRMPHIV